MPRSLREQIANKCKHFNGIQNKECRAGVSYESFRDSPGGQLHLPCFRDEAVVIDATCLKCEWKTEEEIQARLDEIEGAKNRIGTARKAIVEHLGGPWKIGVGGSQGVIDCPCCKAAGALAFTRSGHNGHIHAKCRTDGCVSWME